MHIPWYLQCMIPLHERIELPIIGRCSQCFDPEGIDRVEGKIVCLKCLAPTLRAAMFGGERH